MAKNSTATYHPRQIWETNLAPFVVAAREGATHAANTANRERTRIRQQRRWRQRWLVATAAGLAIVGATAGVCVAIMRSASANRSTGSEAGRRTGDSDGSRSTKGAGREKVAGMARNMRDKLKRSPEPAQAGATRDGRTRPAASPVGSGAPDEAHNQTPVAGGGYRHP